jgi:hypothetical protein
MTYEVLVIDNFAAPGEGACADGPTFETMVAAVQYCKGIVDEFLRDNLKPGMSADDLMKQYTLFGEDPFVVNFDDDGIHFSGWDYAEDQCVVLCAGSTKNAPCEAGYVVFPADVWAWGWRYHPERSAFTGAKIAYLDRWRGEKAISPALAADFRAWQAQFSRIPFWADCEVSADGNTVEGLSWTVFHEQGVQLAKRLKHELGAGYVVIYSRPSEDQAHAIDWHDLLVRMDGSTAKYVHRPYWAPRDSDAGVANE